MNFDDYCHANFLINDLFLMTESIAITLFLCEVEFV